MTRRLPEPNRPLSNLPLLDDVRDAWDAEPRAHRLALVAIGVVALVMRAAYIAQPMRYDESVTFLQFVRLPWHDAVSAYSAPNNHIFHTLLVKAAVALFGESPWVLRLPAFVAGLLIVPATWLLSLRVFGSRAALVAAAFVASSGELILYSTNARGYTMVVLAFLLLGLLAVRTVRGDAMSVWICFALIAALGLWTIPIMLYPLGTVCLWFALSALVADKPAELKRLGVAVVLAGVLAAIAYAPVVSASGMAAITRNRFVTPSDWPTFLHDLPHSLWDAAKSWTLGLHPVVAIAFWCCVLAAMLWRSRMSAQRVSVLLAAYAWCAWLLVVNHRAPFPRVWLWLLPVMAAFAGAGLMLLLGLHRRTRKVAESHAPLLAVTLCVLLAASLEFTDAVLESRDTGTYRDAPAAAVALTSLLQPGDRVLARTPTGPPLAYYLHLAGLPDAYSTLDPDLARRIIVVVDRNEGQTLDRLVSRTYLMNPTQFAPPRTIARLNASDLVLFERVHAQDDQ